MASFVILFSTHTENICQSFAEIMGNLLFATTLKMFGEKISFQTTKRIEANDRKNQNLIGVKSSTNFTQSVKK